MPHTLVNLAEDNSERQNRIQDKPELADKLVEVHRKWVVEVGEK
jgi:hypothetical protein